ncbi:ISL3 family transposase [Brevibacillus gelatini]|uniref:ISL3 family transposase n=5 Tax=Brevibacillus TaxID=55080 RepID=UPI003D81B692
MCLDFSTDFIRLPSFHLTHWEKTKETDWIAVLEPHSACHLCPICLGASTNHARPGRRILRHRFVPSWGTVWVSVPVYRQRCASCMLTWTVEWNGIPPRGSVTSAFQEMAVDMCRSRDLLSVAKQLSVAYSTLERWYYQLAPQRLAQPKEHEAPEVVCLDEFALQKGHKYGVNLMDAQTGHIWQVTEGRSREQVRNALQQWPFRKAPHVVVTDLAPGMAETVRQVWKHTLVVADKFHVIQLFSKALEATRKRTHARGTHRRGRHEQRLLHTIPDKLKPEELQELKIWLAEDPHLERLYFALQDIRTVYAVETQEAGEEALQKWIVDHLYSPTPAVRSIAKTIVQWQEPIQHYFSFRVTNAKIEGTHNKVKVIKRRAYGYRNLERFKIRIRLECKPAT